MLKKIHMAVIAVSSLLLLFSLAWGMLWHYAEQRTVPPRVQAGGLSLSGMNIAEAVAWLDNLERALLSRTVDIRFNEAGDSRSWTVQELGYTAEFAGAREALAKLREGGLWERAAYRRDLQTAYPLVQGWDRERFIASIHEHVESLLQEAVAEPKGHEETKATGATSDKQVYDCQTELDIETLERSVQKWAVLEEGELEEDIAESYTACFSLSAAD